jgi:hypothetical protein
MRDNLRYLLDYVAIRELCARYNRYADAGDGENYAELFTEDAEFHIVGPGKGVYWNDGVYRGRQEIASCCARVMTTVHITTDPLIEIQGDLAQQTSRTLIGFLSADRLRNEIVATGIYRDELKRTPEGWRFYRRRAEIDLQLPELARKQGRR